MTPAKLDEIERTIRQRKALWRAMNDSAEGASVSLDAADADALLAEARAAATLRALIEAHNAPLIAECGRTHGSRTCALYAAHDPGVPESDGRCPDCPMRWAITLADTATEGDAP